MQEKKQDVCLLLKTVDNRHFFTEVSNFPYLIEFAKIQNAEVSVVKVSEKVDVLPLPKLAKFWCDTNSKNVEPKYEVLERKISVFVKKPSRQRLLAQAKEIRQYIEAYLLTGSVLLLKDLVEKYRGYCLTEASLRKHITYVRLHMAKAGVQVSKTGVGTYQLQK